MHNKSIRIRIAGALFVGVLIFAVYQAGYTRGRGMSKIQPQTISTIDAKRNLDRYLASDPPSYSGVVKALVIDLDQYQAMAQILTQNSSLGGFRIYYGMDEFGKSIKMVVGLTQEGKDNTSVIYSTSSWMSGICPPICDATSPIVQN